MLPLSATLWLFCNFDEEQPKLPEKKHTPLSAADVRRPRPYKTSEINIRLSAFATNEQYHQMCGRANIMLPLAAFPIHYYPAAWCNPILPLVRSALDCQIQLFEAAWRLWSEQQTVQQGGICPSTVPNSESSESFSARRVR
jgi:hypothetical protein